MKKRILLLSAFALLNFNYAFSQQNHWKPINDQATKSLEKVERSSVPKEFKLYNLNTDAILADLKEVNGKAISKTIQIPNAEGEMVKYTVKEASTFHPDLQAKFQDIRSYVGTSLDGKSTIRFSHSPYHGLSAMIFNQNHTVDYIDAYTTDLKTYITYSRKNVENTHTDFVCHTDDSEQRALAEHLNNVDTAALTVNDGKLRKYRLALSTTFEYSRYHYVRAGVGTGTDEEKLAAVLSALNVAMTRVNGVYEKEVGVTMELVPNNDLLVHLTSDDPFTNNSGYLLLDENQQFIDSVIGDANYDIGHVFSTGGGGVAQLQSPCRTGSKARGVTGQGAPINDPFYIDYVAHEMGHQYGAPHTFNNSCGGNRSGGTAAEPGSGSTIMAYAGICSPNVQSNSDPYFHAVSVNNIFNFIKSNVGSCSVNTNSGNSAPVITLEKTSYSIPHSTAFVLDATATDADGDALTYAWEQIDVQIAQQAPISTNTGGPTFRSLNPKTESYRYFPTLPQILQGKLTLTTNNFPFTWEVIPSVTRNLNFSLLVRDNNPAGGQTDRKNVMLKVVGSAGPFKVTSQTTAETWDVNVSPEATITWDVAGTDGGGIDTQFVNILLSKDGGTTFETVLASNVPNNGSATITIPANVDTNTARIMIKAVDNVFLAVNSANFTIVNSLGINDVNLVKAAQLTPNPSRGEFEVITAKNNKIHSLEIFDTAGRKVYETTDVKYNKFNVNQLSNGVYMVQVKTTAGTETHKLIIKK